MAGTLISLLSAFMPLAIFIGLFVWFYQTNMRQTSSRYEAMAARATESMALQRRVIELEQQSVALLQEIRDSLRGKP